MALQQPTRTLSYASELEFPPGFNPPHHFEYLSPFHAPCASPHRSRAVLTGVWRNCSVFQGLDPSPSTLGAPAFAGVTGRER